MMSSDLRKISFYSSSKIFPTLFLMPKSTAYDRSGNFVTIKYFRALTPSSRERSPQIHFYAAILIFISSFRLAVQIQNRPNVGFRLRKPTFGRKIECLRIWTRRASTFRRKVDPLSRNPTLAYLFGLYMLPNFYQCY